jgi:hypothetical protein
MRFWRLSYVRYETNQIVTTRCMQDSSRGRVRTFALHNQNHVYCPNPQSFSLSSPYAAMTVWLGIQRIIITGIDRF